MEGIQILHMKIFIWQCYNFLKYLLNRQKRSISFTFGKVTKLKRNNNLSHRKLAPTRWYEA